jgi:hypothetical protein
MLENSYSDSIKNSDSYDIVIINNNNNKNNNNNPNKNNNDNPNDNNNNTSPKVRCLTREFVKDVYAMVNTGFRTAFKKRLYKTHARLLASAAVANKNTHTLTRFRSSGKQEHTHAYSLPQ